jgi:hypothetical protein
MLNFLYGIPVGMILALMLIRIRRFVLVRLKLRRTEKGQPTYGWNRSPIALLRKILPTPPPGYAWEIAVSQDKDGDHKMKLTLRDPITQDLLMGFSVSTYLTKRGSIPDNYDRWNNIRQMVQAAEAQVRKMTANPDYVYRTLVF